MKFVILAAVLLAGWAFSRRVRRNYGPAGQPRGAAAQGRKGNLFSTRDDAVNVRSADNVRLISDEQLDTLDDRASRNDV